MLLARMLAASDAVLSGKLSAVVSSVDSRSAVAWCGVLRREGCICGINVDEKQKRCFVRSKSRSDWGSRLCVVCESEDRAGDSDILVCCPVAENARKRKLVLRWRGVVVVGAY
jgi:hypothetical protein